MPMDLTEIKDPSFLKKLSKKELQNLADEIRAFLIETVSKTGGHLSSNLGVVELTIAMHYVFDSPKDKLLFDVGHQCYTHKILTGRAASFKNLRQFDGMTGFIKRSESEHDIWESGHSSTTISAQCGYLLSQGIASEAKVVALIGDASIANGVAFEALNHMGSLKHLNPIIVLNDNTMSISRSVGATSRALSKLRSSRAYQKVNSFFSRHTPRGVRAFFHSLKTSIKGFVLQENLFEDWGYDYMGPYDGNDLMVCIRTLDAAKHLNKPCVIHFVTSKGKGYSPAEHDENGAYHGVGKFNIETGVLLNSGPKGKYSYSRIMAECIEKMLAETLLYVITPAMMKGCELDQVAVRYPQNIIDVGMAEEHAAVMASAMAQAGKQVILLLYSTFAQRAYDYLLNDIARTDTHVIIGIDRADIVPGDGETHQGIYDIAMLSAMPNMQIVSPKDGSELFALLQYARTISHPIAVRYAKSYTTVKYEEAEVIERPSWKIEREGTELTVITYGELIDYVEEALRDCPRSVRIVNARFIKPMDEELLREILSGAMPVLIYENSSLKGGLTSEICYFAMKERLRGTIGAMGFETEDILPCGDVESIRRKYHLAKEDILSRIETMLEEPSPGD